ncbi:efflux RND transporter periplasmic adaptor subunit [Methyloterricola oryzae]|uniref:efflux RND transporter periplasmic adaptor subunit n=1 Tax=Methyloterricola oryzae TaxID=1495050 RepID=UPI0005EAECAE|nr:efflux RND transporter periplasmic adaptor subunit [Methyloterricola oryzae]
MRLNLKTLLPALLLMAGAAAAWAIVVNRPMVAPKLAEPDVPLVRVLQVEPQTLRLDVPSQGVASPREEIDWVAEVAGKVIRVSPDFVPGGFFTAGQELLAIDPRDYDHAIAAAQAGIAEARRMVAQEEAQAEQARSEWQALGEGRPSPLTLHEPQLAEARARLKASEADLAKARLQRSRCDLKAPFAGRVLERLAGLGHYVQPGEKLARLYSTDVAVVRLPVSTEQLAYLDMDLERRSQPPTPGPGVRLTAWVGGQAQHWQGRIVRSEGRIDPDTGLLHLVAEVREPYAARNGAPLLPGLFVQAEIEGLPRSGLYSLPVAVMNAAQEALLVDKDERLRIRKLEVLRQEPDRVLVRGGLNPGDRVVLDGVSVPVDGMRVKVEDARSSTRMAEGR